ncbi:uncharacterized protein LOC132196696 [Neocloeon triangulifer]|uniref:uncharacterized protein LOC132196696 n=1 Tax=Neocloeon triangulifer TaxID=2078957 RepID=UPI00286EB55C|nr:uncharacterized protein LOC132196696 [Neocloeon triangulifer]
MHKETNSTEDIFLMDESNAHYFYRVQLNPNESKVSPSSILRIQALGRLPKVIKGARPGIWASQFNYTYRPNATIDHGTDISLYGQCHKPGDIIGVHINMVKQTIEFSHNGRPKGIAYRNVVSCLRLCLTDSMKLINVPTRIKKEDLQLFSYKSALTVQNHKEIVQTLPPGMAKFVESFKFFGEISGLGRRKLKSPNVKTKQTQNIFREIREPKLRAVSRPSRLLKFSENDRPKRCRSQKKCFCCA